MFAGSDTISKYLSGSFPIFEFIWIRYVLFLAMAVVLAHRQGSRSLHPNNVGLQVLRGFCVVGSSVLFVYGARSMNIAQATTINFLSPMLVTVLSIPLLRETVGLRRWAAVVAGLIGMLIVVRPGLGGFQPAALFGVASAFCWASALIITRMISNTDTAQTTVLWSAGIGAGILTLLLPLEAVWPEPWQLGLSLFMGLIASGGQWLVILAHRHAAASVLAPFFYTQLLWVTGLGFLVFGNLPDTWTLAGAGVIVASGLYTAHRERLRRRTA
ncbi:MAG TPA: DMT family transporter [Rhodopila sp.]|uniref:DMT family transporter n=1 Tax=Rhodopila sp. TaxID=2480087 RepID=UPI002BFC7A6E|nr:DMT family transporter [Rhodopila sp.]HVY15646.1 DMT family transporter [Rhodopila sp.]